MKIEAFFDKDTFTLTYVVYDENSKDTLIIDPVWDYDPKASKLTTTSLAKVYEFLEANKLNPLYVLETHAHADHLTGAQVIKQKYPNIKIGIGANITKVQTVFKDVFNLKDLPTDGSQFDVLLTEENDLKAGTLTVKTIYTPGHTPACSSYLIGDALFTGDALFMEDYGTGRCDFPAGSSKDLYHSVKDKIYGLPDDTRIFVGHDYQPQGRDVKYESTVKIQKQKNIQLNENTTEDEFVNFRNNRDATLAAPRLLLPSVQTNIRAGLLPDAESNEMRYFKIPIRGA